MLIQTVSSIVRRESESRAPFVNLTAGIHMPVMGSLSDFRTAILRRERFVMSAEGLDNEVRSQPLQLRRSFAVALL